MAQFTNLFPEVDQTNVARTTLIRFAILNDSNGVKINSLNVLINNVKAISLGSFSNGYNGNIYVSAEKYTIGIYPKSPNFLPSASDVSIKLNVLDSYDVLQTENYHFYIDGYNKPLPPPIPPHNDGSRACLKDKPEFYPTTIGIQFVKDEGVGTEVSLYWEKAIPHNQDNIVLYNVYYSTDRNSVFENEPEFLVDDFKVTIGGISPGDTNFFGVRAVEIDPIHFTFDGFKQAGSDMYFYPVGYLRSAMADSSMLVPLVSTEGFPEYGFVHIDNELIKYNSIQLSPPGVVVATSGRGYQGTIAESHDSDSEVRVYCGIEDGNKNIVVGTPSFQKPNYSLTWERTDGHGDDGYRDGMDGYDGYRNHGTGETPLWDGYDGYFRYHQTKYDSVTTNGDDNDNSGDFSRIGYCANYSSQPPASFMQGQCRASYFGGTKVVFDKDGNRHLVKVSDVQTHMLQREEVLLETTGEPMVLLRRQWVGTTCLCVMLRQQHPDARCPVCFGTGYVVGYGQVFNPRRADRRILVRVEPATDDLDLVDNSGWSPKLEPTCWTISFPMIKDRDVLVRFNHEGNEIERYEILSVDRVRSLFGQTGVQKFKMKKLPKTDIIYQFPVTRKYSQNPNIIYTSTNSGSGLAAHSHGVVVPVGIMDYSKLKVATFENQGHNHIIINGKLYDVLNHTHTLPLL
jgi:hypothetical protein